MEIHGKRWGRIEVNRVRICNAILLLFGLFCQPALLIAEDVSSDILLQAISNSGDLAIRSGEFRYTLRVSEEALSSEKVSQQVDMVRDTLRRRLEKSKDNPARAEKLRKAIDTAYETVAPQVRANSDMVFQYYFAFDGPEMGGDRFMEISRFDRVRNEFWGTRQLLMRSQGSGDSISVEFDPLTSMVMASDGRKRSFQPSQEPHRLGRINGSHLFADSPMDSTAVKEWLEKSVTDIEISPVENEPGVETFKTVFKIKLQHPSQPTVSGSLSMTYHIVPSRGFITPLIQVADAAGQVLFKTICKDYFLVPESNLWFPLSCESTSFIPGMQEPRVEQYTFERESIRLNHKIPIERFAVSIPPKTQIIDATGAVHKNYKTSKDFALTIDGMAQLAESKEVSSPPAPVPLVPVKLSERPWIGVIFWGNIALILGVVWLIAKKRFNQS